MGYKFILSNCTFNNLFACDEGGEDDDFYERVKNGSFKILKPHKPFGRYLMLSHKPDIPNPSKNELLGNASRRFKIDGLNSIKYKVVSTIRTPLYTKFMVHYNITDFLVDSFDNAD